MQCHHVLFIMRNNLGNPVLHVPQTGNVDAPVLACALFVSKKLYVVLVRELAH